MMMLWTLDNKKNKKEKSHETRGNKLFTFGNMERILYGSTVGDIILFIKININSYKGYH